METLPDTAAPTQSADKPAPESPSAASETAKAAPKAKAASSKSPRRPKASKPHALDHDGDSRKGGARAAPALQHLVAVKTVAKHGVTHGEVIAATPAEAKALLKANAVRTATDQEIELAQPRVRRWTAPA